MRCLPAFRELSHSGKAPDLTCWATGELETGFEVDRVTCEAGSAIIFTEGEPAQPVLLVLSREHLMRTGFGGRSLQARHAPLARLRRTAHRKPQRDAGASIPSPPQMVPYRCGQVFMKYASASVAWSGGYYDARRWPWVTPQQASMLHPPHAPVGYNWSRATRSFVWGRKMLVLTLACSWWQGERWGARGAGAGDSGAEGGEPRAETAAAAMNASRNFILQNLAS